jgi:lysophospholipid acyltransferase (LPLAT)-like uncharacterized protein
MLTHLLTIIGELYIRLLGWSTRYKIIDEKNMPDSSYIYAFWHSRLMFLVYSHRGRAINVLISKSRDGQVISNIVNKFGFRAIRGSTDRAGSRSAIEMIKCLKKNNSVCAVTPDGPKGPRYKVKDGLAVIAQKTGYPIVPMAYSVKKKKILSTWDKFLLPLPFNKGVVLHGSPIYVNQSEKIQEANQKISWALELLTRRADKIASAL